MFNVKARVRVRGQAMQNIEPRASSMNGNMVPMANLEYENNGIGNGHSVAMWKEDVTGNAGYGVAREQSEGGVSIARHDCQDETG